VHFGEVGEGGELIVSSGDQRGGLGKTKDGGIGDPAECACGQRGGLCKKKHKYTGGAWRGNEKDPFSDEGLGGEDKEESRKWRAVEPSLLWEGRDLRNDGKGVEPG